MGLIRCVYPEKSSLILVSEVRLLRHSAIDSIPLSVMLEHLYIDNENIILYMIRCPYWRKERVMLVSAISCLRES